MSDLGMGVMISMLFGSRGGEYLKEVKGKTIKALRLDTEDRYAEDALVFEFEDGSAIKIYDGGQSCCEARWMHTDDDLDYYVGSKLMDAELRAGPEPVEEDGWSYKESEFLIITTSLGQFTIVNYNEHNGYYGGFWIMIAKVSDPIEEEDKDDVGTVLCEDSGDSITEVEGQKH